MNKRNERETIYNFVARHCDRPADFWFNYRYMPDSGGLRWGCETLIKLGWGQWLLDGLICGLIRPEVFCEEARTGTTAYASRCATLGGA